MGRWYCCNDSYVSLSTLQEVLSEKVYILFFTRANQRPVSASGTFASNGVKSHENCKEAKGLKATVPLKAATMKPNAEQSLRKPVSTISKVEKVPSAPRLKFNISGNSPCKGVPPTKNGKVNTHKNQNIEINGAVKDSVHKEKSEKDLLIKRNDSSPNTYKSKRVDSVDKENGHGSTSSENGDTLSVGFNTVKPDLLDDNGMRSRILAGRTSDPTKPLNGGVNGHSDTSGAKRKSQESSCILLAQDLQSLAKVRELKEEYAFPLYLSYL